LNLAALIVHRNQGIELTKGAIFRKDKEIFFFVGMRWFSHLPEHGIHSIM
jgi:hypothetical protein